MICSGIESLSRSVSTFQITVCIVLYCHLSGKCVTDDQAHHLRQERKGGGYRDVLDGGVGYVQGLLAPLYFQEGLVEDQVVLAPAVRARLLRGGGSGQSRQIPIPCR